jgi:CheY-like chemotaxis protein
MNTGNETHTDRGTIFSRAEAAQAAPLIVIVEEQPAVRELLRLMLVLAGYRSRVYADREAILTQREQPLQPGDHPAVLLLDLSLQSAVEAAEYVRRVRTRWQVSCLVLPSIIILTTQPQVQAALGPEERVLLKPFHVHDLLALIQQAAPVSPADGVETR